MLSDAVDNENHLEVYRLLRNKHLISEREYYKSFIRCIPKRNLRIFTYFLASGIDLILARDYTYNNQTVLFECLQIPNSNFAEMIVLRSDAEIEYTDENGSALFYAISSERYQLCKLLLLTGKIDLSYENEDGETVMSLAENIGNDKIIRLLKGKNFKSEHKVLGCGIEGCVIYPAFNNDLNSVSKLSSSSASLEHEYDIYQKLPKDGPYFNKDDILLLPLEKKDKIETVELCNNITEYSSNFQLIMPRINGITMEECLLNMENKTPKSNEWINLVNDILILYKEVESLNDIDFTHGDLNPGNIVYHNEQLIMIDFGFSFFNKHRGKYFVEDTTMLKQLSLIVLVIGTKIEKIKTLLLDNDIISQQLIDNIAKNKKIDNIDYFNIDNLITYFNGTD